MPPASLLELSGHPKHLELVFQQRAHPFVELETLRPGEERIWDLIESEW